MEYTKQPLDNPQILQMLKSRGLIIKDDNEASAQLKIMSYFRLANYLRPMELDKNTHTFKPNDATHPGNDFKQQLKSLLKTHPNVDVSAMGFPAGWEKEQLWK